MKRSILLILIILALLLTACGAPAAPEAPKISKVPTPEPVAAPEPPDEPEPAEPVEASEPFPCGLVGIAMPTEDLQRWYQDGNLIKEQLEALGYEVDLEYAQNDPDLQIAQLEDMIANGAKVLIISPIDDYSLENVLDAAKEAGAKVIAYDRMIWGPDAVSYFCEHDIFRAGQLQGQYVVDQLDLDHAEGKVFNIEFLSGDPLDGNVCGYFGYEVAALLPYADKLNVPSSEYPISDICFSYIDFSVKDWDTDIAEAKMADTLDKFYSNGEPLDAIICMNDSTAQGAARALEQHDHGTYPIITGLNCDIVSVINILEGKQSMSVLLDTRDLANAAVEMADAIMKGQEPPINDREMYHNGTGIIPTYLVAPRIVTIDNLKEMLIDSGYYTPEQIGIDLLTEAGIEIP